MVEGYQRDIATLIVRKAWAFKGMYSNKWYYILNNILTRVGRDNVVGIATGYELDGSGDQILVGARFSAPVQTVPGAHPTYCTMGTG
jgi:hypothetical protein